MSVPLPNDDAPVRTGDVLAGKYRVERVLGVGGMGVVVAATQIELQRLVALKFVLPNKLSDREAVERFVREARAAVKLKSEHVAKVLDVGRLESGAPYMVMEFLDGSDLDSVLRKGPVAPELAAEYIVQACEALAEAHSIGLVHRDLKPHNLFLSKGVGGAPLIKVLDFGISKLLDADHKLSRELTRTTSVLGSPFYMSPEQMRSARKVDQRSDIWSLGVILYELLTTHVPWEAETITELALLVSQEPPTPIEQHRADVPEELRRVIDRCLQKDANARYANAGELATDLVPFAAARAAQVAQRARRAAERTLPPPPLEISSAPSSRRTPQIGTSTHAATWGDGASDALLPREAGKSWRFPVAAAIVVVAGAAIVVVSTRDTTPPIAPQPNAQAATTTAVASAPHDPKTTPEPTTATPMPPATTTTATPAPSTEAPTTASTKGWLKPWSKTVPTAAASPSATTPPPASAAPNKTSSTDDDIPTIR